MALVAPETVSPLRDQMPRRRLSFSSNTMNNTRVKRRPCVFQESTGKLAFEVLSSFGDVETLGVLEILGHMMDAQVEGKK